MRYVSKFVLCFTTHEVGLWELERLQTAKVTCGICNSAIRQATYDFLLVFRCNYVSILHR